MMVRGLAKWQSNDINFDPRWEKRVPDEARVVIILGPKNGGYPNL